VRFLCEVLWQQALGATKNVTCLLGEVVRGLQPSSQEVKAGIGGIAHCRGALCSIDMLEKVMHSFIREETADS
jgi:hypothetical protein